MVYRRTPAVVVRLEDNRARILKAACDLVAEDGWRHAQVAAVAAKAGLATGTISTQASYLRRRLSSTRPHDALRPIVRRLPARQRARREPRAARWLQRRRRGPGLTARSSGSLADR